VGVQLDILDVGQDRLGPELLHIDAAAAEHVSNPVLVAQAEVDLRVEQYGWHFNAFAVLNPDLVDVLALPSLADLPAVIELDPDRDTSIPSQLHRGLAGLAQLGQVAHEPKPNRFQSAGLSGIIAAHD
jgi:hypothetical protein